MIVLEIGPIRSQLIKVSDVCSTFTSSITFQKLMVNIITFGPFPSVLFFQSEMHVHAEKKIMTCKPLFLAIFLH